MDPATNVLNDTDIACWYDWSSGQFIEYLSVFFLSEWCLPYSNSFIDIVEADHLLNVILWLQLHHSLLLLGSMQVTCIVQHVIDAYASSEFVN